MNTADMRDVEVDDLDRHYIDGVPFTGEIVGTDPSGVVFGRTLVRDGWEDGPQRGWYPDGRLKYESTIRMGTIVGTDRRWHPNGVLAVEREFDGRGRLLLTREWDESGRLVGEFRE